MIISIVASSYGWARPAAVWLWRHDYADTGREKNREAREKRASEQFQTSPTPNRIAYVGSGDLGAEGWEGRRTISLNV